MGGQPQHYLGGLTAIQQETLTRVNQTGITKLRLYLDQGNATAFLGAGASVPLYPLWDGLIVELIDLARDTLNDDEAASYTRLARTNPDAVVDIIRRKLGPPVYREALRQLLRVRRHGETGRTFTPTHELVVRSNFARIVTTNYDPGIIDARAAVRPHISVTGFASYTNDDALERWATGDIAADDIELPILFAHGRHDEPDRVVLATTEYRRAYRGKLGRVLAHLQSSGHLVWIGFSFNDARIAAILREIADTAGTVADPGQAPRHVALIGWDPDADADPETIRAVTQNQYAADVILYPNPNHDHRALQQLLAQHSDPRYPPIAHRPAASQPVAAPTQPPTPALGAGATASAIEWVHGGHDIEHFTGRVDELARLDRWAADPDVTVVAVTAWGGAGKTALITHWLTHQRGATRRPGIVGLHAWSFYQDNSAEHWAQHLLGWSQHTFAVPIAGATSTAQVLDLLAKIPLIVVLDGLEVTQHGPGGAELGRLLDGILRDVLIGQCQQTSPSLAVLTSRLPFADLEAFCGANVRMLDVTAFTAEEGAQLLAANGGAWLPEADRRAFSVSVDGHALAVDALGRILAARPTAAKLNELRAYIAAAARTDQRVSHVLDYYSQQLTDTDRRIVALVSLFQRPVTVDAITALGAPLDGEPHAIDWNPAGVETAVRARLGGLLTWHPDATISAHPLVRDTFRALALTAATAAADLTLTGLPAGVVTTREQTLQVVEMIELLLDANQWGPADDMCRGRTGNGKVFHNLPAARLGQRTARAFAGTAARQGACRTHLSKDRCRFYLNGVAIHAMNSGDLEAAVTFLEAANTSARDAADDMNLAIGLRNLSRCHVALGRAQRAAADADQARNLAIALADTTGTQNSLVCLAVAYHLDGSSRAADAAFADADRIEHRHNPNRHHLNGEAGTLWGELLVRTGRLDAARHLTLANQSICQSNDWNDNTARCDRILGRCHLAQRQPAPAAARLGAALTVFRAGDMVTEMASTLADLGEQRRQSGDLDAAEAACNEAIALAGPRQLVAAHAAALAVRGRIRGDKYSITQDPGEVERARDDAADALRLATTHRHLPWSEHDALQTHAHLDQITGTNHGWQTRAEILRVTLIPCELDPDPLTTIEIESAAAT